MDLELREIGFSGNGGEAFLADHRWGHRSDQQVGGGIESTGLECENAGLCNIAVKQCASYLEELGCIVTEDYPKELLKELNEIRTAISRESKWGLKRLAEKWGTKSISPTITGRANRESVSTAELTELLEKQDHNRSRMLSWMKNYDIVLNPVFGKPAGLIDIGPTSGDGPRSDRGANFNGTHNTTGWPAAVVRAAASPEGLPIGVQVIGQPWRDDHVLATAAYLESRTGGWQMPPM